MSLLAVELWVGHNAARLHQFGAVLSPVLLPRRAGKAKATTPPAERPTASKATPPTTLEVVVLDPRGEPVSGAVVAVSTGREAMPRPHSGRTGTRGSVKLAVLFTSDEDDGQGRGVQETA